jgi:hypothetical protein
VLAGRQVTEGERRIALLSKGIEESRTKGLPTGLSENALATMLVTLHLMRDHLSRIEADLALTRNGVP